MDIVYANYHGGVTLLRNDCDSGHVVNVDLRGTVSNRYGVGAVVRVESGLGVQMRPLVLARGYMSSSEPMLHFGLGGDTVIRKMVVTWPSGRVQAFQDLAADMRYTVTEPAGRSPCRPRRRRPGTPSPGVESGARVRPSFAGANGRRDLPAAASAHAPESARPWAGGRRLGRLRAGRRRPGRHAARPAAPAAKRRRGPVRRGDGICRGARDRSTTDRCCSLTRRERGGRTCWSPRGERASGGTPEYQPRLLLNDGLGGFRPAPEGALPPLPVSAGAVAAADFDRSGRLGVFIGGRVQPGAIPWRHGARSWPTAAGGSRT